MLLSFIAYSQGHEFAIVEWNLLYIHDHTIANESSSMYVTILITWSFASTVSVVLCLQALLCYTWALALIIIFHKYRLLHGFEATSDLARITPNYGLFNFSDNICLHFFNTDEDIYVILRYW